MIRKKSEDSSDSDEKKKKRRRSENKKLGLLSPRATLTPPSRLFKTTTTGPSKLPSLGKELGKTVKSFQTAAKVRVEEKKEGGFC